MARAVTFDGDSSSASLRLNESWRRLLKTAAMLLCESMMSLLRYATASVCAVSDIGGILGPFSSSHSFFGTQDS